MVRLGQIKSYIARIGLSSRGDAEARRFCAVPDRRSIPVMRRGWFTGREGALRARISRGLSAPLRLCASARTPNRPAEQGDGHLV